jgi:hypothetical protein
MRQWKSLARRQSVLFPLALWAGSISAPGCTCGDPTGSGDDDGGGLDGGRGGGGGELRGVWLAQTHVQRVGGVAQLAFAEEALSRQVGRDGLRMLELVGGRDTLLLVDPPHRPRAKPRSR